MRPPVYTVVGVTAILGSEWSITDAGNDMTKQEDGIYALEKTNVLLNKGDYEYQVIANHSWDAQLMGNQTLTIAEAGYHTITFTYNASTNVANATATLTQAEEVDPVIKIKGQFDNENPTTWVEKDLTLAEDKKIAATTLTLTARSIEMGILLDGNWNSNGATITSTANSTSLTTSSSNNMLLYAPVEGAYTFTYTLETKTLVVTFPNGTTLPLVKFFGSWDSWATGVIFTPAEDNLTATAKLSLTTGSYTFKITKDAAWLTNSGTMTRDNCTEWTFESGTNNATLTADEDGEYTFTWTYAGDKLSVTFPATTATDFIGINTSTPTCKLIRNGQVLIVREGVTYNMMGQTVQ